MDDGNYCHYNYDDCGDEDGDDNSDNYHHD